jgi:protein phosphatase
VDVKVTYTKLRQGDGMLLCSDGLYNMVKAPEMLGVVNGGGTLPDKCKSLLEKANENGGTDNITVIMAEVSGPGLPPADPAASVEVNEFREADFKARP